jgi:serine/threonine protein kinase
MEENGYVRITDMGIARILKTDNSADTSGTPGYMAPEVMCRQNHSFGVDYSTNCKKLDLVQKTNKMSCYIFLTVLRFRSNWIRVHDGKKTLCWTDTERN